MQDAAGAVIPGGMGVRFDWSLLQGVRHPLPWRCRAGKKLDPFNVAEASQQPAQSCRCFPQAWNSAPGIKDPGKIAAFLDTIKSL